MPSIMLIYDRPTDVARRSDYNGRVRDWIGRLMQIPGVVSLLAQRAVDAAASPNTIVTLEFRKLDQAQAAISSEHLKTLLQGDTHRRVSPACGRSGSSRSVTIATWMSSIHLL